MSYSSGTFTINSVGQPVVTGTVISSTVFNALTADLATGLSTCVLKDGTQTITGNIPMNSKKFTGLAAGTASGDSIRYEQVNGVVTIAGDILYATGAGVLARLAIGTARQQLATNSGATAPEWVASLQSLMTTTGDIVYASSGNTPARLAIGTAYQQLITNAGATAPSWAASLQSLMTAQGDIVYASAANTPAKLAAGTSGYFLKTQGAGANPIWAAIAGTSQTVTFTYNTSTASGNQAITGAGFTPSGFVLFGTPIGSDNRYTHGFAGSNKGGHSFFHDATNSSASAAVAIYAGDDTATHFAKATVSTWDSDGVTFSWVKTNLPTLTWTFDVIFFK